MKQTALEWLSKKTFIPVYLFEQCKQMEKEQIIDAAERWKGTDFAERYYNETYGSKGSNEPKKIRFTEEEWSALNNGTSQTEISDEKPMRFHCIPKEISDEEIYKEIEKLPFTKHLDDGQYNDGVLWGFELGAKWYREQLKNRNQK